MQNAESSLPDSDLIESPTDLRRWLLKLRSLVAEGGLSQNFEIGNEFADGSAVSDIPIDGPWPDFIEWYFEAPTGVRYRFSVETYHGTGGCWQRL